VILDVVLLSLKVAFFALCWTIPLGYCIAFLLSKTRFRGREVLSALVMLPLVMPPVVTGLLLLYLFAPSAPLGQFFASFGIEFAFNAAGASLAAGLVALPLIVRPIRLSFDNIDHKQVEALRVAGLSNFSIFRKLFFPLSLPGVLAGGVLGFAKSLGEFGATITFVANIPGETRTFSLAIHSALQQFDGQSTVVVLCAISISISAFAVLGSEFLLKRLEARLLGQAGANHA
jgi:molybdate transport system permease protein